MNHNSANQAPGKQHHCPSCGQSLQADPNDRHFPFCSARCRNADLAKWLNGDFIVSRAVEQADLDEGE